MRKKRIAMAVFRLSAKSPAYRESLSRYYPDGASGRASDRLAQVGFRLLQAFHESNGKDMADSPQAGKATVQAQYILRAFQSATLKFIFVNKMRITMAVLIILLLFALLQIDRESLLQSIRQVPVWLIILLGTLQIITQFLVNLQWHQISKIANSPMSFRDMFYINCQGAIMDCITPGVKFGGEVTRAVQISRIGNLPGEHSAAIVALQKLFSLSALFFILIFTVGYLVGQVPFLQARHLQFMIYGLLSMFILIFIGMFIMPGRIIKLLQNGQNPKRLSFSRVRSFLITLFGQIESVRKNKRALAMLSLLSLFIWLLYPAKMYILAIQFLPAAHAVLIAAITFAAYMVAMLPIFPGGIGGFEGTMSGLLVSVGYAVSDAATMTIIFRFITFWFVMMLSVVFIAFCKASKSIRERGRDSM